MWMENYKSDLIQQKIIVEQRTLLWKSASDHFAKYIINWDRVRLTQLGKLTVLNKINQSECSKSLNEIKSSENQEAREERYLQKRDDEKDLLVASLEEARVLYRNTTVPIEIKKFDTFRDVNKNKDACELPDVSELRKIQEGILLSMLKEMSKSMEGEVL